MLALKMLFSYMQDGKVSGLKAETAKKEKPGRCDVG
jgi:hypothetical protein